MSNCKHMGMYINIASIYIRRNLDALFTEQDFSITSGTQGRILGELVHAQELGNPIYQKDMEKSFGIRRSSVNSLISNLEANGLIERVSGDGDARLKRLLPTSKGIETYQKICHALDSFEEELANEFSPEEKEQVLSMMQRIIAHYEKGNQPVCDRKELTHD